MTLSDEAKAAARKQLEFYFSDSNLPRDAFMLEKVSESSDGFVPLALLCTFKRMRKHLGLPDTAKQDTVNEEVLTELAAALEQSDTIAVKGDKKAIKRKTPLDYPTAILQQIDVPSLYAAPFPHDATLDAMIAVFEGVAPVVALRMRRHIVTKDFRGSVFVEFGSEEVAQKVMAQRLEFAGAVLQMQPKAQYLSRKKDAAAAKTAAAAEQAKADGEAQTAGASKTATAAPDTAGQQATTATSSAIKTDTAGNAVAGSDREGGGAAEAATGGNTYNLAKGCCVSLTMDAPVPGINFHAIKQALGGRDSGVRFLKFSSGDKEGFARFRSPEDAAAALANAGGNLSVESATVKLELMTGDAEAALLNTAVEQMKAKDGREAAVGGSGRGGRGRGGYGRGGGGRGRGGRGRDGGRGGRGGGKRKFDGDGGHSEGDKSQRT